MELYAETNQVGIIGRAKADGMPVLAEAFARAGGRNQHGDVGAIGHGVGFPRRGVAAAASVRRCDSRLASMRCARSHGVIAPARTRGRKQGSVAQVWHVQPGPAIRPGARMRQFPPSRMRPPAIPPA